MIGENRPNGVFGGDPAGVFWFPDRLPDRPQPPQTEAEFRANLAVPNLFNTGENFIQFPLTDNLNIWRGKVGQQPASIRGYILPGGGTQFKIQNDPLKDVLQKLETMPTPWNQ